MPAFLGVGSKQSSESSVQAKDSYEQIKMQLESLDDKIANDTAGVEPEMTVNS